LARFSAFGQTKDFLSVISHSLKPAANPERVLVLGEKGFVAARLIGELKNRGWNALSIGSDRVDLTDPGSVDQLLAVAGKTDAVVMTSALTPEKGKDRRTFQRNLSMAEHVCSWLEKTACAHFIYLSSDAVYADSSEPLNERSPCHPATFYALAHLVRERFLLEQTARSGLPLLILRPCAIYGEQDTHNSYGPNQFVRSALQSGNIGLFGQGEEIRPHLYIDDFIEIILLALRNRTIGILNAAPREAQPFHEVARQVVERVGGTTLSHAPRRQPITHRSFDDSALREAFPEFAFRSLGAGLDRMIQDLRNPR